MEHFESLYPSNTRFEEVQKILDYVKSGNSCEALGLPGTGKNNLLGMLSYNRNVRLHHLGENQKWMHFVSMDFSEVKNRPLADVVKFMLISLTYSLSERKLESEHHTLQRLMKDANLTDELILFQTLKRAIDYLAIEKELTIVFLFDRFEQYIPEVTEQFFTNLKILRNRAKYRFSVVFSLTRPLEDILERAIISEFYEFLGSHHVYLRIYDPVGIAFRLSYLEKATGKKADEKTKKEIVQLCAGHGKLCRVAYEAVLASYDLSSRSRAPRGSGDLKTQEIASPDRHRGRNDSLLDFLLSQNIVQGVLSEIWNALTPAEQSFVKTQDRQSPSPQAYLEHIGLIHNRKITIPLFEAFIQSRFFQAMRLKSGPITYDVDRNEILKGRNSITEKLSPSEFRLLRFLIKNSERICEKDELISAVWRDTQTLAGVSDQALDQIIYRLRKKIEDDPNHPTHIQTIKGRGVKFTQ